jgi:hypothetical protein
MPKQINSDYNEVGVPFSKMSFTPDVPTSQLGPNEYNDGLNVETDVRGIRSTAGDLDILTTVPGIPTFVTSGFRQNGEFWFIVATYTIDPLHPDDSSYNQGRWYATNGQDIDWYEITPGLNPIMGYNQATNITEAWNGTVPFFNDSMTAPMFLSDEPNAVMTQYTNKNSTVGISSMTVGLTTVTAIFDNPQSPQPFQAGDYIVITGINNYYNGRFLVQSADTTQVIYYATPGASVPSDLTDASISLVYTWNYNPNWKRYNANFMRLYATPNVGSILVAGNLNTTDQNDVDTVYPVTVQWSQAFGLNQAPDTWEPTITNVANQLEVPLRGPALDGFPCNGQFFLCSYWDTVVFSPLNFATTNVPILGVRLFNQGRGLLSSNCWANTDKLVYGVDARDVWVFDGTDFKGLGNQRVKNWFFDQMAPEFYDRVFMEVNSQKNQVEIYYPDSDAINGVPNKMLSYRYDLDVWNAPRDIESATMACESPIWTYNTTYSRWEPQLGSRTIVYACGETNKKLIQKDYGYEIKHEPIYSYFKRSNIKLLKDYSGKLMVHRLLPEAVNIGGIPFTGDYNKQVTESTGNVSVKIEGANSVGQAPNQTTSLSMKLNTNNPWLQPNQNSHRVNSITIENTSSTDIWMCTQTTWQFTQTEDDR